MEKKSVILYREKEPDVVVLDIIMPKMDGLAVMERFVHDSRLKKIPSFIVVSAVGKETNHRRCFQPGCRLLCAEAF